MAALRRLTAVGLGVALTGAAVLGFAAPAQAHNSVVASTPVEGETLAVLPADFAVTSSQTFYDAFGDGRGFGILIQDAAGLYYGDGCVSIVDATMSTPASLGAAGAYTMTYRYVSADSHPTSGAIAFAWAPAEATEPAAGRTTAPVCGEADPSPEPTMSTQETPAASPAATPSPSATGTEASDTEDASSTLFWIGGAGLAVVAAVVVTLLLVRPKKRDG